MMEFKPSSLGPIGGSILALLVLSIIALPTYLNDEPWPRFERAADGSSRFGQSFEKNFSLLPDFRWQFNYLRFHMFGVWPEIFLAGQHGWIFYKSELSNDGNVISDFLGARMLGPGEVRERCESIASRNRWLRERGISFATLIIPNKETVYSDQLPDYIRRHRGLSRLEQLSTECAATQGLIDIRTLLNDGRIAGDVYYHTDTHLTSYGTFLGYEALMTYLRSQDDRLPILRSSEFGKTTVEVRGAALEAVGADGFELETRLEPEFELPACYEAAGNCLTMLAPGWDPLPSAAWTGPERRLEARQPHNDLPNALVFHDSFMRWMAPFLAQSFRHVTFIWGQFDQRIVDTERPDVVIVENVERYLDRAFSFTDSWPALGGPDR